MRTAHLLAAGLLAAGLFTQPAGAVSIDFDLNNGSVFVNPNPNYFSGPINLPTPMVVLPGQTLDIWINFVETGTNAQQHLKIFDLIDPTNEDFGVSVEGSGFLDAAPTFDVEFSGVMGDIIGTMFQSTTGFCSSGTLCVSGVFPVDLTDTMFSLQDIHISFALPQAQTGPATVSVVTFGFALDDSAGAHEIATWAVPEPGTFALLGLGLLGLAATRRRMTRG